MSSQVNPISDERFEADVLQSDLPVLVDFWAQWCQPCKMLAPIVEEVAPAYTNRVKIFKMNVDENSDTPTKYGIRGIPSLLIFKHGNVVATHVGMLSKAQLSTFLDDNL